MNDNDKEVKVLETFIDQIDSIDEGDRNSTLYKIGCKLRKKFGLTKAILLRDLRNINEEKCNPPLEVGEVETIARSVDRSNTPLGRVIPVDEYLQKPVSLFGGVRGGMLRIWHG